MPRDLSEVGHLAAQRSVQSLAVRPAHRPAQPLAPPHLEGVAVYPGAPAVLELPPRGGADRVVHHEHRRGPSGLLLPGLPARGAREGPLCASRRRLVGRHVGHLLPDRRPRLRGLVPARPPGRRLAEPWPLPFGGGTVSAADVVRWSLESRGQQIGQLELMGVAAVY
eukprot:4767232-Prymnesium_polylepis.1